MRFVVRSVRCSAPARPRRCTVSVSSSPSRMDAAAAPGWSRSRDPASRSSTRAARSAESRFHASRNGRDDGGASGQHAPDGDASRTPLSTPSTGSGTCFTSSSTASGTFPSSPVDPSTPAPSRESRSTCRIRCCRRGLAARASISSVQRIRYSTRPASSLMYWVIPTPPMITSLMSICPLDVRPEKPAPNAIVPCRGRRPGIARGLGPVVA